MEQVIGDPASGGQQILIAEQIGDPQGLFAGLASAEDFAGATQLQIAARNLKTIMAFA